MGVKDAAEHGGSRPWRRRAIEQPIDSKKSVIVISGAKRHITTVHYRLYVVAKSLDTIYGWFLIVAEGTWILREWKRSKNGKDR